MSTVEGIRPRVLLDVNVLISYLLRSGPSAAIADVVDAAIEGRYTLLLPGDLVSELASAIASKPYLSRRISEETASHFVALLLAVAEVIAPIGEPIPAATCDPQDDYLLAYALVGSADYLVSGDRDLLSLGRVGDVRIISPSAFVEVLASRSSQ